MYAKVKTPCLMYMAPFHVDFQVYLRVDDELIKCGPVLSKNYYSYPLAFNVGTSTFKGFYEQLTEDILSRVHLVDNSVMGGVESMFDADGKILLGMIFLNADVVIDCRAVTYQNSLFRSIDFYGLGMKGSNNTSNIHVASRRIEGFKSVFQGIPTSWFEVHGDMLGFWQPESIGSEIATSIDSPFNVATRSIGFQSATTVSRSEPSAYLDVRWSGVPNTQVYRPEAIAAMDRMHDPHNPYTPADNNPWLTYSQKKGYWHAQTLADGYYDMAKADGHEPVLADLGVMRAASQSYFLRPNDDVIAFHSFDDKMSFEPSAVNIDRLKRLVVRSGHAFSDAVDELSPRYSEVFIRFLDVTPKARVNGYAFRISTTESLPYPFKGV